MSKDLVMGEIYTGLDNQYNRVPQFKEQDELKFHIHDIGVNNFFLYLYPFDKDLGVRIGVKKPDGTIFYLDGQFIGLTQDNKYLYEFELQPQHTDQPGKYPFELYYVNKEEEQMNIIIQHNYRVSKCFR